MSTILGIAASLLGEVGKYMVAGYVTSTLGIGWLAGMAVYLTAINLINEVKA